MIDNIKCNEEEKKSWLFLMVITSYSDVGAGQGKEIASILSDDGKESQRPVRGPAHSARNRKKRRLNDLESDSTAAESEDEFMISNR